MRNWLRRCRQVPRHRYRRLSARGGPACQFSLCDWQTRATARARRRHMRFNHGRATRQNEAARRWSFRALCPSISRERDQRQTSPLAACHRTRLPLRVGSGQRRLSHRLRGPSEWLHGQHGRFHWQRRDQKCGNDHRIDDSETIVACLDNLDRITVLPLLYLHHGSWYPDRKTVSPSRYLHGAEANASDHPPAP